MKIKMMMFLGLLSGSVVASLPSEAERSENMLIASILTVYYENIEKLVGLEADKHASRKDNRIGSPTIENEYRPRERSASIVTMSPPRTEGCAA